VNDVSDPDTVTELHPTAKPVTEPDPDGTTGTESDQRPTASVDQQ
jgi:hypothetical protein